MARYTNQDCWSALLFLAHVENRAGKDMGLSLDPDSRASWIKQMRESAAELNVPIRHWQNTTDTAHAYSLDIYNGVIPIKFVGGGSAAYNPRFWPSGLRTDRRTFVLMVRAAASAIEELTLSRVPA